MKRLLAVLLAVALPAGAVDFNEVAMARASYAGLLAQIVQIPTVGGGVGAGDVTTWTAIQTFTPPPTSTCGIAAADNECWGSAAGSSIATGATDNTFVGDDAGNTVTTGDGNVVIGSDADIVTAGDSNAIAIGFQAIAEDGISIGYQAGASLAAGGNLNVLIGSTAGDALTTGDNSTCVGMDACSSLVTGGNATGVGLWALQLATGGSNTALGMKAGAIITTGGFNTFLGAQADGSAVGVDDAVAVGVLALAHADQGTAVGRAAESADGVAIGYQAGDATAAADVDNVFIGNSAGTAANGTSTDNVFVGDLAGDGVTTGDDLVLIGADADLATVTHSDSVAVGSQTIVWAEQGVVIGKSAEVSDGVAIGYLAGGPATAAVDVDNVFIGNSAGTNHTTTSTDSVCVGDLACAALTTGDENVAIGADADVSGSNAVAIGFAAVAVDAVSIGSTAGDAQGATDNQNVCIGNSACGALAGGADSNTMIGYLAGSAITGAGADRNVIIGSSATASVGDVQDSVIIGQLALVHVDFGTAVGKAAEAADGVAIGYLAGGPATSAADVDNVFVGNSAGTNHTTTSTDNTCIGDLSCATLTTGDGNVIIGADADISTATLGSTTAVGTTAIVHAANGVAIGASAESADSVSIGYQAGDAQVSTDVNNVLVGNAAGTALSAATDNTCVGDGACATVTTGDQNVMVGSDADSSANGTIGAVVIGYSTEAHGNYATVVGWQAEAAGGGISIGFQAGDSQGSGDVDNVFIGYTSGTAAGSTATDNTCLGDTACDGLTTGDDNTMVGANADSVTAAHNDITIVGANTLGWAEQGVALGKDAEVSDGVAIGYLAGGPGTAAADVDNVFIGNSAGTAHTGTSTDNVCIGDTACNTTTSGDNNVVIGADADVAVNTTSDAVAIGMTALVHLPSGVAVGRGAEAADGVTIGYLAGDAMGATDTDAVLIGTGAGGLLAGGGEDNTCVGDVSCAALTTGDRNTLLGADTDVGTATDSDQTIVGQNLTGKGSDSILIGFGGQEHYYHHGAGKALAAGSADEVFGLSVATISYTSATVSWVVVADDSTNAQSLAGMAVLWAINVADTEDCNMEELTAGTDEATSSGTLTAVPTWAAGTNECIFNLNAASSLTETTLDAFYTVTINGPATTLTLK